LIAVGAILRYAVTTNVEGVEITLVVLILLLIGVVGLLSSLLFTFAWSPRRGGVVRDRVIERDPYEPPPRYWRPGLGATGRGRVSLSV
jgi:hypothetical protein